MTDDRESDFWSEQSDLSCGCFWALIVIGVVLVLAFLAAYLRS